MANWILLIIEPLNQLYMHILQILSGVCFPFLVWGSFQKLVCWPQEMLISCLSLKGLTFLTFPVASVLAIVRYLLQLFLKNVQVDCTFLIHFFWQWLEWLMWNLLCYYAMRLSMPCKSLYCVRVVIVVSEAAGVSVQHRGGPGDAGCGGLQVWVRKQQGESVEAEFTGWWQRSPRRCMTDGYHSSFCQTRSAGSNDRLK